MTSIPIGVDLGTSNSCASFVTDGTPRVVPNDAGDPIQASIVAFLARGRVLVGNRAKNRLFKDPPNTIFSAKRLMGRYIFSEEVKKAKQICPYRIVEGPNKSARIQVGNKVYSPQEISAMVLSYMKRIAEKHVGQSVRQVVLTVPANFNDNQRQATKDAAIIAGLEPIRILNEPTAAALAYGLGRDLKQRVAVYDLGGGTFDLSVLEIDGDVFEVIATGGDTFLGGDDFDRAIVLELSNDFKEKEDLDLTSNPQAMRIIKRYAEQIKIHLSDHAKATVVVPASYAGRPGQPDLKAELTRDRFQAICLELIQRTFLISDEVLHRAGVTASQIDEVVCVGGQTRMPLIQTMVGQYFGRAPLAGINPMEVVGVGAGIHADMLAGESARRRAEGGERVSPEALLIDVAPMTLRLGTAGGYTVPIIEKNCPVPIDKTRVFTTAHNFQDQVTIKVFQGDERRQEDNELLGEFTFSGFDIVGRGEVSIEVTFEIDPDGILQVSARDRRTGQIQKASIELSARLSQEEIEALIRQQSRITLDG